MTTLIIFNRAPYDGTDVSWNALRLADKLLEAGGKVRIFLMNDSVDMARDASQNHNIVVFFHFPFFSNN